MTTTGPQRRKLPDRRAQRTQKVALDMPNGAQVRLFVSGGFTPGTVSDGGGQLLEVFLRGAGKSGSGLDLLVDDLAVLLSLSLQSGWTPAGLRTHLTPVREGVESSLVAGVLDVLTQMQDDYLSDLK